MKSAEIRKKFLDFFKSRGHTIVHSSSLVPKNDQTLLFTNSGMIQFKDVFLGTDKRYYTRAASVQRCLRAGGKHNDLENVGYTARHHTFFEMLGNWSFGDYFKRESLKWSWELLTKDYGLLAEKLWVTVYQKDEETYNIWINEIGLPKERVVRIGDNKGAPYTSDNFWQMADTGPCGPCSEIFYDYGPNFFGGPPGTPEANGDRYIEIWNNVFIQFNQQINPLTGISHLVPLPISCVDTGIGLERLAAILQHVHNNYKTDIFQPLIKAAARETHTSNLENDSLKVIADHIRAASFLVADGVLPSNEGRGYVLRRIIRRALRHGYKLGQTQPFFYKLVPDLITEMSVTYPELLQVAIHIKQILQQEEECFSKTLKYGMKIFEAELLKNPKKLNGNIAFTLYDTYGFPLDLTENICRERHIELDKTGFNIAMKQQKDASRVASKFKIITTIDYHKDKTCFVGYETLIQQAKVIRLYVNGIVVNKIEVNQEAIIVLNVTPFYAESGGQIGDTGVLESNIAVFTVVDTKKIQNEVFGHYGKIIKGTLIVGDYVNAKVDIERRKSIMRNHSATHLMHQALRKVFGTHIIQKGSLVDDTKIRFDFNHKIPISTNEIQYIEEIVNREILANTVTQVKLMSFKESEKVGAIALLNEKYNDEVQVVSIGSSLELCCGTHVTRTSEIGLFKIIAQFSIAADIRRIEAVSGSNTLIFVQTLNNYINIASTTLKTSPKKLIERILYIQDHIKILEKKVSTLKIKLAFYQSQELLLQVININGVKVLVTLLKDTDTTDLYQLIDILKIQLKTAIIVLSTIENNKVTLVAGVTTNIITKIKANELVNFIAKQVDGKGGGRSDIAQANGTNPSALQNALKNVINHIANLSLMV